MMAALHEPIIGEDSIRHVNFFNGRLLTGTDLRREQFARYQADGRLGQTIGSGIDHGLYVELIADKKKPIARVKAGLALNRNGQTLWLGADTDVELAKRALPPGEAAPCLFEKCTPAEAGGFVEAGQGLFVLTIAPSHRHEGRAPMNALGDAQARCNTDAEVEAVQFRLIQIPLSPAALAKIETPQFRNAAAHQCFGAAVKPTWARTSFANADTPNIDNLLRGLNGLHDFDVPLALIAFGEEFTPLFADNWSVRRMIAAEDERNAFSILTGPARARLGQAMMAQFQDQLAETQSPQAKKDFDYLPPVGVLEGYSDAAALQFFAGLTVRGPVHIDEAQVEPLIRESLSAPAIPTTSDHTIWLYRVAHSGMGTTPGTTLLFASGHLPYRADARFNLNYWDHANYALIGDDCCDGGSWGGGDVITPPAPAPPAEPPEPAPDPKQRITIEKAAYEFSQTGLPLDFDGIYVWGKNLMEKNVKKAFLGQKFEFVVQDFYFAEGNKYPGDPDIFIQIDKKTFKSHRPELTLFDQFGSVSAPITELTDRKFNFNMERERWLRPNR